MPESDSAGPVALVTGVSRRGGIGFAIAERLLADGWRVLTHGWTAADSAYDAHGTTELLATLDALGGVGERLAHVEADFSTPDAPASVMRRVMDTFGRVDAVVANHAVSVSGDVFEMTAADLDLAWAVNARASALLAQAFGRHHDRTLGPGSIVLFTSGQHLGAMGGELPYAISKGAIQQMTASLADTLAPQDITVNAINPGPNDTGWPDEDLRAQVRDAFPAGRWGRPSDIAPVVVWLLSAEARWVTGQTINAEGGFRR